MVHRKDNNTGCVLADGILAGGEVVNLKLNENNPCIIA